MSIKRGKIGLTYWQQDKKPRPQVCPRCGRRLRLNQAEFARHRLSCGGQ